MLGPTFAARRRWALLLVLLLPVGFSNASLALTTGERLRGSDVIRRERADDLPELRSMEILSTEILQVQGVAVGQAEQGLPICSYSLDFVVPADEAKHLIISASAVNPKTCTYEFEVRAPVERFDPADIGIQIQYDDEATPNGDSKSEARLGFAHPEGFTDTRLSSAVPALSGADYKMTILGWWVDPQPIPNLRVNSVSVALRAHITNDRVVDASCKFGYDWLDESGWIRVTTNPWDEQSCRAPSDDRAVGYTNAAFFNDHFCASSDTRVYYEKARITIRTDRGRDWYEYGERDTWGTGFCPDHNVIRWDDWAIYPNEYWRIHHTD